MNAKQSLSSISENQDLWVAQYRQEILERDYNSGLSAAENRGIAKGMSKGLKEGMSKGLKKGMSKGLKQGITVSQERGRNAAKLETARNLLRENVSEEVIARCTGLPLETVQQLAVKLKETAG